MKASTGFRLFLVVALSLVSLPGLAHAQCGVRLITSCPDDMMIPACEQADGTTGAFVNYTVPAAADDCGPVELTLVQGLQPGAFFPEGETLVEWRSAFDDNGNYISCIFRVTATWNRTRTVCSGNMEVPACDLGNGVIGAVVNYPVPIIEDDCGPIDLTLVDGFAPGEVFPEGETRVEWRSAFAANGDYISCIFRVTARWNRTITFCPEDTVIQTCAGAGAVVDYAIPTAADDCGPIPLSRFSGPAPGETFPPGLTRVEWITDLDSEGSYFGCLLFVNVIDGDIEPPALTCPDDIVAYAMPGQASAVLEYQVQAVDNCPGDVTLVCTPPSGSTFSCGETLVTCTATDLAQNQSTCTFTVTVARPVPVDFRPGNCPNPLKTSEQGILPVAIAGTSLFDVTQIDPASVRLEGVAPLRWSVEDVAVPYVPELGKSDCLECNASKKDRVRDLSIKFDAQALIDALGPVMHGECRVVRLTGNLLDGCPIAGEDVVRIQALGNQLEPATSVAAPKAFALSPNHPNPFSPETSIGFSMAGAGDARLVVYDLSGRQVRALASGVRAAGSYSEVWDGRDETGSLMPGGVYFYRLTVEPVDGRGESFREQRKMLLTR